jgi:hypothetical protein
VSLTKSYATALFLAVMMLPGALFIKFGSRSISFKKFSRGVVETIYLLLIVLLIEYLAIFLACFYLFQFNLPETANILFNPLFIYLLLVAFWGLERFLGAKFFVDKARNRFIEFTSERKKVTIETDSILYIESRDDIVFVVTMDGKHYRTKMNITAWSNIVDKRFARVHRAFIVNRNHVKGMFAKRLELVSGIKIEVSKRYLEDVNEWLNIRY